MPFSEHSSTFGPDDLELLTRIWKKCCMGLIPQQSPASNAVAYHLLQQYGQGLRQEDELLLSCQSYMRARLGIKPK